MARRQKATKRAYQERSLTTPNPSCFFFVASKCPLLLNRRCYLIGQWALFGAFSLPEHVGTLAPLPTQPRTPYATLLWWGPVYAARLNLQGSTVCWLRRYAGIVSHAALDQSTSAIVSLPKANTDMYGFLRGTRECRDAKSYIRERPILSRPPPKSFL
jgi:hypothetical protein